MFKVVIGCAKSYKIYQLTTGVPVSKSQLQFSFNFDDLYHLLEMYFKGSRLYSSLSVFCELMCAAVSVCVMCG